MSVCPVCHEKVRGKSPNKKKIMGCLVHKTCLTQSYGRKPNRVYLHDISINPVVFTSNSVIYGQKPLA